LLTKKKGGMVKILLVEKELLRVVFWNALWVGCEYWPLWIANTADRARYGEKKIRNENHLGYVEMEPKLAANKYKLGGCACRAVIYAKVSRTFV